MLAVPRAVGREKNQMEQWLLGSSINPLGSVRVLARVAQCATAICDSRVK